MSGIVVFSHPGLIDFWTERHLCTFTTLRRDGSPHVVAVGATLLGDTARIISSSTSAHVRHIRNGQTRVAICQVDGPRWSTVEGTATVFDSPEKVAEGEKLYAARYRTPRPNPARVVIEISVTKILGSSAFTG
ncbi:pyridoxamine 5'-phosphate oxidase family protein [Paractinoplanes durhamensis]|uniref:PPOX class F420-dependent enzyme n=1 Tax=Paractinoplanes durhamensis TaxID=113563 RepID=A0ABQ3YTQ9_9ACTN|nr:pyridoxamine 5'-phosphate oxidase family protein [Actinoplanes durhamensis]GIE00936.1 PPOX class F420-dependent enzyme [Actinoplanes durhamensis]